MNWKTSSFPLLFVLKSHLNYTFNRDFFEISDIII